MLSLLFWWSIVAVFVFWQIYRLDWPESTVLDPPKKTASRK